MSVARRRDQEGLMGKGLGDKEALGKEKKFAGACQMKCHRAGAFSNR